MIPNPEAVTAIAVSSCSLAAAAIDLRTRHVPNLLTGATAAVGLALALTGAGRIGIAASLAGCVIGLVVMLPGYLFGATGGGDVKLLAALGTLLGPERVLFATFVMAVGGGVIALAVALYRRRLRHQMFAYAPAIAIGAIVALLK
jgi:prepilin peptidase CpaA